MNLIVILTIGIGMLLVVFCLALRSQAIGFYTRAMCLWLARPFAFLTAMCLQAATACQRGSIRCLTQAHKGQAETDSAFLVGSGVSKLVYLAVSPLLVIGGVPIDTLRAAMLYGLVVHPLHLPLDSVMGILFVLVPGTWALLLAEAVGLLPTWAHLLPQMQTRSRLRWGVGISAGLLFLGSLVVVFFFTVYGQCVLTQQACASDASFQFSIVGFFSVLLAASGLLGLVGTMVGLSGLVGCVLAGLACVCYLLHVLCGLLGTALATFARTALPAESSVVLSPLPGQDIVNLPLLGTTSLQEGHTTETEQEISLMQEYRRTTTIIGFGSAGSALLPVLSEAAYALGATGILLAGGLIDLERIAQHPSLPLPGLMSLSPSVQQMTQVLAEETGDEAYTTLAYGLNEQIVAAYKTKHGGTIGIATPMSLISALCEPLRTLKVRLSHQHVLLVTIRSQEDETTDTSEDIALLAAAGIETCVIDPQAPFARQFGEATQETYVAYTLIGLCVSHLMDSRNMTFAEVGQRLRSASPMAGMSFCTAPVASGKAPWMWKMAKAIRPRLGDRGSGDFTDLLIQAKACTDQVMHAVAALDTTIGTTLPLFLIYTIPLRLADSRFHRFVATMDMYAKRLGTSITTIVVRANPPAPVVQEHSYRCSVSACYPVPLIVSLDHATPIADTMVVLHTDVEDTTVGVPALNGTARRGRKPKPADQDTGV